MKLLILICSIILMIILPNYGTAGSIKYQQEREQAEREQEIKRQEQVEKNKPDSFERAFAYSKFNGKIITFNTKGNWEKGDFNLSYIIELEFLPLPIAYPYTQDDYNYFQNRTKSRYLSVSISIGQHQKDAYPKWTEWSPSDVIIFNETIELPYNTNKTTIKLNVDQRKISRLFLDKQVIGAPLFVEINEKYNNKTWEICPINKKIVVDRRIGREYWQRENTCILMLE